MTEMSLHEQDEFVVVASDGLWDVMDSQDAVTLARNDLRKGHHPQQVAERLAGLAVKRHTADNVAVILVDLGKRDWAAAGANRRGGGLLGGLFG